MRSLIPLDPDQYKRHAIHGEGRCWAETNCYVDVLIEFIHSLGFEPNAALAFTLSVDFDVDQWTFFKFRHIDMLNMYGMDVQELNPWRSLAEHVEEQVNAGRGVLVEMDSYFLPDTAGTAYKLAHVKSTIAVNEIDIARRHMGYFHGQGYYHLDGQDFEDIFQLNGLVHDRMLPPYIELVRLDPERAAKGNGELVELSVGTLRHHLNMLPESNPFFSFRTRFEKDLEWLRSEPIDTFHNYSFATLRQYGACFELAETYLRWLGDNGEAGLDTAIDAYSSISTAAKTFQFKLARALARKKELDLAVLDQMAESWQSATDHLRQRYL